MISFAITVKDEIKEIKSLITLLIKYVKDNDEIVIIRDSKCNNTEIKMYLDNIKNTEYIKVFDYFFENNFADLKNNMISRCKNKWIFNIDADELPNTLLLLNLHNILTLNDDIDKIWIPRINIVNGITPDHIRKWNWTINDKGWINWPHDHQCRIYKNNRGIYWVNRVHEKLEGGLHVGYLPNDEKFAIYHIKDIDRQEKQNAFYETL